MSEQDLKHKRTAQKELLVPIVPWHISWLCPCGSARGVSVPSCPLPPLFLSSHGWTSSPLWPRHLQGRNWTSPAVAKKNIPSFFCVWGRGLVWGRLFCCWESFGFNIAQPNVPVSQQKIKTKENFRGLKLCYRVSCNFLSSNLRQQRITISGNQHQGKGCLTLKITDKKLNTPFRSPNLQIQSTLHVSSEKT